jgi:hypothetical protein
MVCAIAGKVVIKAIRQNVANNAPRKILIHRAGFCKTPPLDPIQFGSQFASVAGEPGNWLEF